MLASAPSLFHYNQSDDVETRGDNFKISLGSLNSEYFKLENFVPSIVAAKNKNDYFSDAESVADQVEAEAEALSRAQSKPIEIPPHVRPIPVSRQAILQGRPPGAAPLVKQKTPTTAASSRLGVPYPPRRRRLSLRKPPKLEPLLYHPCRRNHLYTSQEQRYELITNAQLRAVSRVTETGSAAASAIAATGKWIYYAIIGDNNDLRLFPNGQVRPPDAPHVRELGDDSSDADTDWSTDESECGFYEFTVEGGATETVRVTKAPGQQDWQEYERKKRAEREEEENAMPSAWSRTQSSVPPQPSVRFYRDASSEEFMPEGSGTGEVSGPMGGSARMVTGSLSPARRMKSVVEPATRSTRL